MFELREIKNEIKNGLVLTD